MTDRKLIPISEFARLSGISRPNLIFYAECGILKPEAVGPNRYRYYGAHQLEAAYLLMTLKDLGMPLREIRALAAERTPEGIATIFIDQKAKIEQAISVLRQKRLMAQVYIDTLGQMTRDRRQGGILQKELPAESLVLGPPIRDFRRENARENFIDFYNDVAGRGIPFGFPLGSVVEKKRLLGRTENETRRLYFRVPASRTRKKTGLYVVGYGRGDFDRSSRLYPKLYDYIANHDLEIAGHAYEDYILNSILVSDPDKYVMRLSIHVRPKKNATAKSGDAGKTEMVQRRRERRQPT
ncbi:MAG: MerR family transcriptional regulator [Planctomycetes bacterium]|nr:MerR family transcriptional regulator [Planctomycetota bacterium]